MFIFLDTETHAKDSPILIQLAYIRTPCNHETESQTVNELFSTGGTPIEFGAMAVHHITEKMIAEKHTFNGSLDRPNLQDRLNDGYILVAHNAAFDVWVLKNHEVETPRMICTLKLARYIYPEFEAHNLQYLRYRLGLEFAEEINPHDALSDVIVLEKLFLHLSKKLAEKMAIEINNDPAKLNDDTTLIQKMTDITQAPSLLHKCIFGKYAGTLWREVPREYLEWIVFKSSFDDADVLYTARHYLSNNSQLPL